MNMQKNWASPTSASRELHSPKDLALPEYLECGWRTEYLRSGETGLGKYDQSGKDLRDVTFANYFPTSFGHNFSISPSTTLEQFEHIEATAIGYNTTYSLNLKPQEVEMCPDKYAIFNAIHTWEEARRADAFPHTHQETVAESGVELATGEK